MKKILTLLTFSLGAAGILSGCNNPPKPPISIVPQVKLDRFMGSWHVIANIPTFIEKGAHNAVESYRLAPDGSIATTFTFRQDSFNGPEKRFNPTGFVVDKVSNAVWDMQFIWPFKSDYRIVYLNDDYTQTVIGRDKRDYVWIMARKPEIPDSDYRDILALLARQGYDVRQIQKVPQQW
ncbi:MAG: lipocalin family protein [Proteobacteria bacterium]|nr:lipocalin family protein [Pseudomonadota bacterium]